MAIVRAGSRPRAASAARLTPRRWHTRRPEASRPPVSLARGLAHYSRTGRRRRQQVSLAHRSDRHGQPRWPHDDADVRGSFAEFECEMIRERTHVELPAMSVPSRGVLFEQATSLDISAGPPGLSVFPRNRTRQSQSVMALAGSSEGARARMHSMECSKRDECRQP